MLCAGASALGPKSNSSSLSVRRFSNRGRGKILKNESLRISQLTNKSTPSVTDASHGLHMPESQDDSDKWHLLKHILNDTDTHPLEDILQSELIQQLNPDTDKKR